MHHEREVAGFAGRERDRLSRGGDRERRVAQHVAVANALHAQATGRDFLRVGTDGDELHHPHAILVEIAQVPIGLVAHEERLIRHDGARLGGDAAPTLGLVSLRDHAHAIGRRAEALQAEIELRLAAAVGGRRGQIVGVGLFGFLRIAEAIVLETAQRGEAGRQLQQGGGAAVRRRRAEQVLEGDARAQAFGRDPAVHRLGREVRGHHHAIWLELAHLHRGLAPA